MSLAKSEVPASAYIKAGKKQITDTKLVALKMASDLSTVSLIWLLVKRHKVAILAVGNVILVLNWLVPAWPTIVRSLVQ